MSNSPLLLEDFAASLCLRLIRAGFFTEELGHAFFGEVRQELAERARLGQIRETEYAFTANDHYAWVVQWSREAALAPPRS